MNITLPYRLALGLLVTASAALVLTAAPVPAPQQQPAAGAATPGAATQPATQPGGRGRRGGGGGGRRGGLPPGPLEPAPVANTLPGLLGKPLKWVSTAPLVSPVNDATHFLFSVKDPTIMFHNNKWEIYATANMFSGQSAIPMLQAATQPAPAAPEPGARRGRGGGQRGGTFNMVHLSFADWKDAPTAKLHYMDTDPRFRDYKCAPHVFYFAPQKKFYYVFQTQPPVYCTSETPENPMSWSNPTPFFAQGTPMPQLPIDFWVIGDGEHMYLFFTGDDGNFYRSRTTYAEFPNGMSPPVVALASTRDTFFEGSSTYKIKGTDKYLTVCEALNPSRYYRAFVADKLDGIWSPVDGFNSVEKPFAGINNVTFEAGVEPWTRQVSHGEMIREGNDERMILDPNNLMFLYQGLDPARNNGDYGALPYKLGLLRAVK